MKIETQIKTPAKPTKYGQIPSSWGFGEIGKHIDLTSGFAFKSNEYSTQGVRLLRCANIKRGHTDWSENITQFWPGTAGLDQYEMKSGDLVIAMDGSLVGRSYAVLSEKDVPSLLLQRAARIRSTEIHVPFLTAFIGSNFFISYCDAVKTVTAIPHISAKDIRKFRIPLPPLPEQKKIAAILSTWDNAISKLKKLITEKEDLKRGLMQQLLTGKKRFSGFTGEWKELELRQIGSFLKGKGIAKSEMQAQGIPAVRYGELYTVHHNVIKKFHTFISPESAANSNELKQGDVVFAGSGETLDEIGKCAAYVDSGQAYAGGDIIILRPSIEIDSTFLAMLLNSHEVVRERRKLGQGHSVVHIYSSGLRKLKVQIPAVEEQQKISRVLITIDNEIDALNRTVKAMQNQKTGLMQQLLTGKVRVKIDKK